MPERDGTTMPLSAPPLPLPPESSRNATAATHSRATMTAATAIFLPVPPRLATGRAATAAAVASVSGRGLRYGFGLDVGHQRQGRWRRGREVAEG